jgi:hypothetical protein
MTGAVDDWCSGGLPLVLVRHYWSATNGDKLIRNGRF